MMNLDRDIAAYEQMRSDLVLVYNERLVGTYDSLEAAAREAVQKFGRGPYLIRQVGAPPVTIPASVAFNLYHAWHEMRLE